MKTALSFVTVPFVIAFFDGMFGWDLAEGFYMMSGLCMAGGLAGAWVVELKRTE